METKRIVFVGVGGQGNLLASRLLGEAALASKVPVQVSEVHGMAQRGGVVESAVVMGRAVSPIVSPGEADVIVGFEPMETLRDLNKANAKTLVITSTAKLPPFTVAIGQGKYPAAKKTLDLIRAKVKNLIAFDALEAALAAGNPLGTNIVLLGVLCAAGDLPVKEAALNKAIKTKTKAAFVAAHLKCFQSGLQAAKTQLG
ncbi:MAG: indolepyruvate oxidoreductase subunit beta [Deltaproteobacteria bacterium]|nr:indolepyruvate oxidoreductase subunit beta [Deltaproteobacteria bacterium]